MKAIQAARETIKDQEYVRRWFDASSFFNTVYTSDVYKGDEGEQYFITKDRFMNSTIWALRLITEEGIETIGQGDSEDECFKFMHEHQAELQELAQ